MPRALAKAVPKEIDESKLVPGAIVLYRLRGYPPWPSLVITEEHVPSGVKKARPQGNVFPLRFFPFDKKAEYAWANPRTGEIQGILTKEEIDVFNTNPKKGTSKQCLAAYQAAAEPVDLDTLKITDEDEDEGMAEFEEEEEEEEEEEDAVLEDVKDLYEDEDDEGTGKKRKRAATDDGDESKKKKKKPSVVMQKKQKVKAEQNGAEPRERKKPGPKPKPKLTEAEKKAAEQAKKEADEQKKAEIRKKEIMYIRHRIQKTLLDKSGKEPDVEELPLIVENLKKLADFNWINPQFIAETKIHKVLKRIMALPSIPQEDTFEIKGRASEILKSWARHLGEISESHRKETEAKKGSGSDNEKSPASKEEHSKDEGERETKELFEPMEDVKSTENELKRQPGATKAGPTKESKIEAESAEGFVMVDAGGEADEFAQEKAAQRKTESGKVGAQPHSAETSAAAHDVSETVADNTMNDVESSEE